MSRALVLPALVLATVAGGAAGAGSHLIRTPGTEVRHGRVAAFYRYVGAEGD